MASQSPIKLSSKDALKLADPVGLFSIGYEEGVSYPGCFLNPHHGHGNFVLQPDNAPHVTFRGRDFVLSAVHIHTPSEHLLEDKVIAAEIHFVHKPAVPNYGDPLLAIGVLYTIDSKAGKGGLSEMVEQMKGWKTGKPTAEEPELCGTITPAAYFPLLPKSKKRDFKNWFHYEGSLTSPPYSENVSWFVMSHTATVSKDDHEYLDVDAEQHAREVQLLERRLVVKSF